MIAIFDIGKTNKKLSLLDEQYRFVHETSVQIPEIKDEDGDPCEDLDALIAWIKAGFVSVMGDRNYKISALNFSSYGASFVPINSSGEPVSPLYNYLKPFPGSLHSQFYQSYGGEQQLALETASPILGHLNSGLQLYRLKYMRPDIYAEIKFALHLPQFLSYIFTRHSCSDMTSIGCHTHLWDFRKQNYHHWVHEEKITKILAPVVGGERTHVTETIGQKVKTGIGLHDSSSALIPYLTCFKEPFLLISTGTWCISMNPFNQDPLTAQELKYDCLCYLTQDAKPVKSSRLFAGQWHDQQTKRIAGYFNVQPDYYKKVSWDEKRYKPLTGNIKTHYSEAFINSGQPTFNNLDLKNFHSYEDAYYQLMEEIVALQAWSSNLVLNNSNVEKIFVDGGFGSNPFYMHMLAKAYPGKQVFAASVPQASSIGAAMILHQVWNSRPVPSDIITLKKF